MDPTGKSISAAPDAKKKDDSKLSPADEERRKRAELMASAAEK